MDFIMTHLETHNLQNLPPNSLLFGLLILSYVVLSVSCWKFAFRPVYMVDHRTLESAEDKGEDNDESFSDTREDDCNIAIFVTRRKLEEDIITCYNKSSIRDFLFYNKQVKEDHNVQKKTKEKSDHHQLLNMGFFFKNVKPVNSVSQIHFCTISAHHPSEINKVPWRQMNQEWWRLHTFSKYPRNAPCSSIVLARQGFVYIGNGDSDDDTVICVFCSSAVKNLDSTVNVVLLHRRLNPDCPVVRGLDCGNILIKAHDEKSVSQIMFLLSSLEKQQSLISMTNENKENHFAKTKDEQPIDDQDTSMEVDSALDVVNDPALQNNQPVPSEQSEMPNNTRTSSDTTSHDTRYQATDCAAPSAVVTNRAQSLSFPSRDVPDYQPSNNVDETHHAAGAHGVTESDLAHSSTPSPTSPSNKSSHRRQNSSTSNNQQRPSDPSRSQSGTDRSESRTPSENTADTSAPSNVQTDSERSQAPPGSATSYDKLGIITARPKRYEYAVEVTRLNSFEGWPQNHHIKAVDLAKAGYFFTGYSDCARCFYCGGGLRNWELEDDVWVEHARWFPKCAFIRQCVGQPFIDVVQDLSKERETIPYQDIINEMKARHLEHSMPKDIKNRTLELERDAAVKTIIDSGFNRDNVIEIAEKLKETGQLLSADSLYDELLKNKITRTSVPVKTSDESPSICKKGTERQNRETLESLKGENSQLRQQSQCKICMDKEVAVVFLPCGHFISCTECSFALKTCPVCRESIKGSVRAYLN